MSVGSYNPRSEHNTFEEERTAVGLSRGSAGVCAGFQPLEEHPSDQPNSLVLRLQPSVSVCFIGASVHPSISD